MRWIAICLLALALLPEPLGAESPAKITFKKRQLDAKFRSEGVGVGDFNHDGRPDIAAGSVYYQAPDWRMVPILAEPKEFDPLNYSDSFANFAQDLNGDGWADLIVVDFPGKETWWFENPRGSAGPWRRHVCTPVTNNESPGYLNLWGDKRPELLMAIAPSEAAADGPDRRMAYLVPARDPAAPWHIRRISASAAPGTMKYSHGLGAGDINGDGRIDVLVKEGWWESPVAAPHAGRWKFHSADFGKDCAQMYVFDFDGDGDSDVLSSSAHAFGIWWHEQTKDGWRTHEIDHSFSQTHSLCMADINGDGLPDFVTGKRFWAHGPKGDVGQDMPSVMFWFELTRDGGKPRWIPHQFDHDSGVGTQFEVADVNSDGLLDVVTSNKKGVFYFQQQRARAEK